MPLQDYDNQSAHPVQGDELTVPVVGTPLSGHVRSRGDPPAALPPVLLGRPGYGGTVAAVRDLGRDAIAISTLACDTLACANWSIFVRKSYSFGPRFDPPSLLAALMRIGAAADGAGRGQATGPAPGPTPGHVLLPVCDISAWTYAAHADQLSRYFCTYAPPLATLNRLLDKTAFEEACAQAGIGILKSWTVRSRAELEDLADMLVFPLIAKPRAHVNRTRNDKGIVAHSYAQLLSSIEAIEANEPIFHDSDDGMKIGGYFFQQFVDIGAEGVLSVAGFSDRSGTQFVACAARKVMLRSEPAGVGVCFESVDLNPDLARATARLCRHLGYFGVFEVEFIRSNNEWAAIDFNPRFYNQMGLDIARGIPLARLCYYDAIGDEARLSALIAQAQAAPVGETFRLRDGFTMAMIIIIRSLTGSMSRADRRRWRQWNADDPARMIDLYRNSSDPWVWPVHVVSEFGLGLRKLVMKAAAKLGIIHYA